MVRYVYMSVLSYRYKSLGIFRIPTISGKITRALLQFTPVSWTTGMYNVSSIISYPLCVVRWHSTGSIKRMLGVNTLIGFVLINDLNCFFLKHILWVPGGHFLNFYRVLIWTLIGIPSLRQLYVYFVDSDCKRLGMQVIIVV